MDCIPEGFHGVVCDGSHWGAEGQGKGLTKAVENLAS